MRYVETTDWKPTGIKQLEPNALKALHHKGSSYVVAGPGAGKTEFLAQRADYLFSTRLCPRPCSILAISFKRDAARNLGERVNSRTPAAVDRFESLTFDAFTKGLVDRFRAALPELWRIGGDYEMRTFEKREISQFLKDLKAKHGKQFKEISANSNEQFVNEVVGTYDLPSSWPEEQGTNELAALAWWCHRFRSSKPPQVDFVMLNRLAELIIRTNPAIHRALLLTYPFVFVDEFQDTTFAQWSFLRSVFGTGQTVLTVVGDPKQRIMDWAGARSDSFSKFQNLFCARRFELKKNHRSTPDMLNLQNVVAKDIKKDVKPSVSQVKVKVEGKSIMCWMFKDARTEANHVARWVCSDSKSRGLSLDSYAILFRQRTISVQHEKQCIQPFLEEELKGRGLRLRNEDASYGKMKLQNLLADEFALRVLDLLRLASRRGGNGNAWMNVSGLITRIHERLGDDNTISRSHQELENFVRCQRQWMTVHPPNTSAIEQVVDAVVNYFEGSAIQSMFLEHRQEDRLKKTIEALKYRFKDVTEDADGWEELCDRAEGLGAVSLMTIHKSKGLEFHTVILLGLDQKPWWAINKDRDEAVRTLFVGLSRAKRRVIFTSCVERGGCKDIESLHNLLKEAGVQFEQL